MSVGEDDDAGSRRAGPVSVALQTVGCKLNQAETESLARKFLEAGFEVVSPSENAEVFLLNTCTVTHIADRKCRQYLRAFRRQNPGAFILVTGCYAERAPDELSQMREVDLVVSNADKDHIVEIVKDRIGIKSAAVEGKKPSLSSVLRTRPLIKIQDGCNRHCTYCIVPRVRGRERSIPAEAVISEIKAREEEGYKEVILTGTQIGSYEGNGGLEGLIRRILTETSIPRVHLSSLQPQDLSPSLVQLWKSEPRICRHLHLPLQSGSDTVLRRMGRSYSRQEYEQALTLIREAIPDIAVTTDVIVGFPGESEEEFEQSYEFCARIGFAGLHVFPYSIRPGTPASRMPNQVPENVKRTRAQKMLELAKESAQSFRRRFLGQTLVVLWEEQKEDSLWVGHTDNYLKVFVESKVSLNNRLTKAKLIGEHGRGLWGVLE